MYFDSEYKLPFMASGETFCEGGPQGPVEKPRSIQMSKIAIYPKYAASNYTGKIFLID